jgi:GNAT superfamily N-acetyltransferase
LQAAPLTAYIWTAAARNFISLDITLLPEHRNRSAGSFLLGQLMAEAKEAGKPVTIYVETFNLDCGSFNGSVSRRFRQKAFTCCCNAQLVGGIFSQFLKPAKLFWSASD